uniref:N-acetyltransferase n=1 Tax=Rhabditophanes sp. KR3021 TaxID=114890 RepID=A0AC35UCW6_9BILA
MKINRNDKGISLKKPLYLTNIAHQIVIEDELFYCGNWDVLINKSLLRMCKYSSSIKLFYQTEKINLFELNNFILEWNRRVALTLVIKHNRPIGAQPMEEKEDTEYGITDQNLGILSNTYNQWIIDSTRVGYGLLHAYIKDELEKENDERIYKYFYLKSVDVNFDTYKDLISKYFTFYSNFIFVEDSTHSVLVMFDIEEF